MTLREALENRDRDSDMIVIGGYAVMVEDTVFTEENLKTEMTVKSESFYSGINRVNFNEAIGMMDGREIIIEVK